MKPCDTCGDAWKQRNLPRDLIREEAKRKANEEKKPFSICKEGDGFAIYDAFWAYANGQQVLETVSGL